MATAVQRAAVGNVLLLLVAAVAATAPAALAADGAPRPGDATWHIGLVDLWGKDAKGESRRLDIYPVFEGGRWVRAVATARRFNTSVHLVRTSGVKLDGETFAGRLDILVTPDRWVPKDGRPVDLTVDLDGKLVRAGGGQRLVEGTYRGHLGGQPVAGKLTGGVGPTETGWEDARWSFLLNPVVEPGGPDQEMIQLVLGVAGGKVQWGRLGLAWRRGPHRECPFDPSGLALSGATVTGTFTVPGRAVSLPCDPKAVCRVRFTGHRVQGLNGGGGQFALALAGRALHKPFAAYGRGGATKGGGRSDAAAPKPLWRYGVDTAPWWRPVAGFQPPAPGEHPRLLFRKGDVPALRRKARTPQGRAILARLRELLGGNGETLPTRFNPTPPHNHNKSPKLPAGTFTTWHAAGYGLLYQVTGKAHYARLARQAVELCFAGKMDRDNRYGWATPGTGFRAGPVLAGIGLAYDLCYDAWPGDVRRKVALSIQNYAQQAHSSGGGRSVTLEYLAGRTGYPPASNHYGAHVSAATGILAILGDPGTDTKRLTARLGEFEVNLVRILCHGFGDHGWYSEGHHPSRVSANLGILPFMAALRSAAGRDYVTPRPNAQWVTLRWIMEIVPQGGRPQFPHRGTYGGDEFDMDGMSHDGEFAYGFGAVEEKYVPALLWVHENFIRPSRHTWGAAIYPHRAVAAFVNWPVGVRPVNPARVMPKAVADTVHGYFVHRNRWKDGDDVVITNLLNIGPEGYHRVKDGGTIRIWGLGIRANWKTGLRGATPVYYRAEADGSGVLSVTARDGVSSLAVDLGGASGAPAMLVGTGPAFAKTSLRSSGKKAGVAAGEAKATAGGRSFVVVTLQKGPAPNPVAARDALRVGRQTVRFDGTKLLLKPL